MLIYFEKASKNVQLTSSSIDLDSTKQVKLFMILT